MTLLNNTRRGDTWIEAIETVAWINTYLTLILVSTTQGANGSLDGGRNLLLLDQINRIGSALGFSPVKTGDNPGRCLGQAIDKLEEFLPPSEVLAVKSRYEALLNSDAMFNEV